MTIQHLQALLVEGFPQRILIVSHRNPDGDAIGSCLAAYHYFQALGHSCSIAVPSDYPADMLGWMPAIDTLFIYDRHAAYCDQLIQEADFIVCLDFNELSRIDKMGEVIATSKAKKILIDHHLYPADFADYTRSDTSMSSTCELLYHFFGDLDQHAQLQQTVATCLMVGILTDTGSFKYATSPRLFRVAAELVERGADTNVIQDLLFNSLNENKLRLLGYCLYEKMEILDEYKVGIIVLNADDLRRFNVNRGDLEGLVNQILKIKAIKVSVLVTEQEKAVKLSLRSKGDFSVQELASKHFKGGGHKNASGGQSLLPLEQTVARLKEVLAEYKEALNYENPCIA